MTTPLPLENNVDKGLARIVPNHIPSPSDHKRMDRPNLQPMSDREKTASPAYLFPNSRTILPSDDNVPPTLRATNCKIQPQRRNGLRTATPTLERALVGGFVRAVIDEEKEVGVSAWSMTLEA
ncbi:hypothetical protein ACJ73_09762 [Blastomyces percursus]|uniref:Uncharacterized protein n=1 Tax=Blastomyces percursus TaxID=1658174 RepID=A0A1J9P2F1_9EURO|nr:hypothetical protein ACJ73_09762 [Blastomyces percursus]